MLYEVITSAPHDIDISVVIYVFGLTAIITEIKRNSAMKILIVITCFLSSSFPLNNGLTISIVIVELDSYNFV